MKPRYLLAGCVLSSILATMLAMSPLVSGQTTDAANFHIVADIDYTQGANGPLKADAYIPNGAGRFPGVVFIHGGGWSGGDRNQLVRLIKDLANKGYVGFAIDYDLDPVPFPSSLHQSLDAVRYFRKHAKEFNLDPARVAVAGSSAGGELAALVALTPVANVRAAVILNGVLDLTAMGDKSKMVTDYLGGPCTTLKQVCQAASPVNQVQAGAPPFYIGHGTADRTVPFSQAENFAAGLRAAKVQVQFFTATDGPHTYWSKEPFYKKNRDDIEAFLATTLK